MSQLEWGDETESLGEMTRFHTPCRLSAEQGEGIKERL
mgnify:CR=1 FL=1